MKKLYFLLLSFLSITTSCAIQGEVYRLQTRMDYWYQLLNTEEQKLFAQRQINTLGKILDQKEQEDPTFQEKIRVVRINEAIMSFDGEQTTQFFYRVMLRDLAKFSYEEFISSLSSEEVSLFIHNPDSMIQNPPPHTKEILDNARNNYGFQGFNDQEIIQYYRTVSLSANYYVVIYDILAFLAKYRSMDPFLQGNIDQSLSVFDNIAKLKKSRNIPVRNQAEKDIATWNDFQKRTHLSHLNQKEFLILSAQILSEMDGAVQINTIENIRERFEEQ